MLQFYQNENLRHKLSKKAIEQAEKFSWEKFVDEHVKIYQEVS
jgi:glycosyltransferase involved in cell wall biosynthesis